MQIGKRELIGGVAVVAVVLLGFQIRRWLRPALNDRDQLTADVKSLATEIVRGRSKSAGKRLAAELVWRNMPREELLDNLRAGTFFWRDGKATLSRLVVTITGAEATTTGDYLITFRRSAEDPMETHGGSFDLRWRKQGGRWQLTSADGVELPPRR